MPIPRCFTGQRATRHISAFCRSSPPGMDRRAWLLRGNNENGRCSYMNSKGIPTILKRNLSKTKSIDHHRPIKTTETQAALEHEALSVRSPKAWQGNEAAYDSQAPAVGFRGHPSHHLKPLDQSRSPAEIFVFGSYWVIYAGCFMFQDCLLGLTESFALF